MPFVLKDFVAPKRMKAFLFLIRELGFTQRDAQRYISKGRIFIDGELMRDPGGDVEGLFQCVMFEPVSRGLDPVFQTRWFALFDKPSGVLVHPQNRHTPYSMVDEIRHRFGPHANITHRIDQETSGLLLSAKDKESERTLKLMFENREMDKRYLAFVHGKMDADVTIDAPLIRQPDDSALVRMIVKVHVEGKPSRTDIKVLHYFPEHDMTLVEAKPLTGRQHQIRVHLFHVKHPIVGDPIYGQDEEDVIRFLDKGISDEERIAKSGAKRLLLHANRLAFTFEGVRYDLVSRTDFISEAFEAMG
ncbi:RluA family pseudouridine synthase [Sulfurimonas sp. HSL1-6]|uniref:RluA family pseudouridine synthase n=1 Tax=Thiomicrolovo immobilis TaxID=3131935 RepID=UPI0031F9F5BA